MKSLLIALFAFSSIAGYSATGKCVSEATTYSLFHVQELYQVPLSEITVNSVSGNAEVRGVDGYVALGVSVSLPSGQKLRVIPMMTPACVLVDVRAFED